MAVGRIDRKQVPLPKSWDSCSEGDFCLSCRRERAAEAALATTPDDCSNEVRAKARRAGLIEFEVRRTPDLTDNTIAKACRTTGPAVAAARRRLSMGDGPPPSSDRDRVSARRVAANR
jgi:hypothetical protein